MYRSHFGLAAKPFQIAPSPKFLYPSETHDESRARVLYGIRDSRGFVVVYGRVGLGKTTVLLSVLEELESNIRTAYIFHPVESFRHLLRMVAHEFGFEAAGKDEVDLLQDLYAYLIDRMAASETCVLIIDEAQNLSLELLERIRTLSNLQTDESSLLQIVLVGQPELYDKLMDPRIEQLRQRVGIWHEIVALDADETEDYILHRLRLAGARRPKEIIPPPICARVHELSGGVPRIVNQICDTALLIAFGRNASSVAVESVDEAARELHLGDGARLAAAPSRGGRLELEPVRRRSLRPALGVGIAVAAVLLALAGILWFVQDSPLWSRLTLANGVESSPNEEMGLEEMDLAPSGAGISLADPVAAALIEEQDQVLSSGEATQAIESSGVTKAIEAPPRLAVESQASLVPAESEQMRENAARILEQAAAVDRWRMEGRQVYSVHLHSFRQRERAESFAHELQNDVSWDKPLFVERTDGDPVWYRVLAGGFTRSAEARHWIRSLKMKGEVGYAQLMALPGGADILLPQPSPRMEMARGVDG